MTLAEALASYLATATPKVNPYAHQELHRFSRAIGLEREVEELAPPEIARYAENVVASGGDVHGRLMPVKVFLTSLKKQGHSLHSLAAHVKIPRATLRAVVIAQQNADAIPMTAAGMDRMKEDLVGLKNGREGLIAAIRTAAEDKDFRENAPLDAARETHSLAESRIKELEETLRRAVVLGESSSEGSGVHVGSRVTLHDLQTGHKAKYTLVDSAEADPAAGKISVVSPVGKAVVGGKTGDEVAVQTPKGERRYKIMSTES